MKIPASLKRKTFCECFYLSSITYFLLNTSFAFYPLAVLGILVSHCMGSSRIKYLVAFVLGPFACASVAWVLYGAVLHTTTKNVCFFRTVRTLDIVAASQALALALGYFLRPSFFMGMLSLLLGTVLLRSFETPIFEARPSLALIYKRLRSQIGEDNYVLLCSEYKYAIEHSHRNTGVAGVDLMLPFAFLPVPDLLKFVCAALAAVPSERHVALCLLIYAGMVLDAFWICVVFAVFSMFSVETKNTYVAVAYMAMVYAAAMLLTQHRAQGAFYYYSSREQVL